LGKSSKDYQISSRPQEVVTRDIERHQYDLSHWTMKTGQIGALQTLSCIPIVAGDTMSVNARCVFRLSPLRQNMYLDAVVDLFAFFVPHRHVYGSNWRDFLMAGLDEGVTLGVDTFTGTNRLQCCGYSFGAAAVVPRWVTYGYLKIWNRYFADPTVPGDQKAMTYLTTLTYPDPILDCGLPVCHLKRSWNTGVPSNLTSADYSLPLSGGEVNLYELDSLKGRLQTEQARDWYAISRYQDILKYTWDSTVNIDADERPELIMRSTQWLSGYDVDGTDDATLGRYTGKSAGVMELSFPDKFFPEHGALWLMAVVRFPAVAYYERGYLPNISEPTYKQIAGDPMVIAKEPPITLMVADQFYTATSLDLGYGSYGLC
jgi:hypothetical protein